MSMVGHFVNLILITIWLHKFIVDTRVPSLREEFQPPRDYRPSKWISNSALDVWYGNKSMVDILSREFKEVVDRIANRPVRSNNESISTPKKLTNDNSSMPAERRIENETNSLQQQAATALIS